MTGYRAFVALLWIMTPLYAMAVERTLSPALGGVILLAGTGAAFLATLFVPFSSSSSKPEDPKGKP